MMFMALKALKMDLNIAFEKLDMLLKNCSTN